jgi:uncharacterized membrane protein YesL
MQQESPFVTFCIWLSRLAWINICWWAMTLAGLIVTGLIPASVVAMQMMRRYLRGQYQVSFSDFFKEWKAEWCRSNLTLWPLICMVLLLSALLHGLMNEQVTGWWSILALSVLPIILLVSLLIVAVLLELSIWNCSIKQGWMNGVLLLQQHSSIVFITALSAVVMLMLCLLKPVLGLFFLFSPVALIGMVCMMRSRPQLFEEHKTNV